MHQTPGNPRFHQKTLDPWKTINKLDVFFVPTPGKKCPEVASSLGLQGPSAPIGAQLLASSASAASKNDHDNILPYHGNLLTGVNSTFVATLANNNSSSGNNNNLKTVVNPPGFKPNTMQASAAEANTLDLQAMQSMDWLFKKERIFLLAQFWQQVNPAPDPFHLVCPYFKGERESSRYQQFEKFPSGGDTLQAGAFVRIRLPAEPDRGSH
ncbi:hypothetical protein KQX54_002885 [Cotesia glomerata]|uniref:Uncharacterized protein n=1 Tax=Cotesia glomerata TaxID=32391 RepID=A0AAV7IUA2_COTGL|nr:hypothetical protein KQX54_002885 [Cotesia glomerata]